MTKRITSILIALMGFIHIGATFSPLISGKLKALDTNTYHAMVYMSLMCGLLLVSLGSYIAWAIGHPYIYPQHKLTIRIAATLLLIDGVSAICFMPHNSFAWAIATLCIIEFVLSFLQIQRKQP